MAGPDSAFSGEYCMGTVCGGNYSACATYRLTSPDNVILPQISPGEVLQLYYAQWYRLSGNSCVGFIPCDAGSVWISVDYGDWQPLTDEIKSLNPTWSTGGASLKDYAGSQVRIRFTLNSCCCESGVDKGWYIDDVRIELLSFNVEAGQNRIICQGDCAQLDGFVGCGVPPYTYQWTPQTGLSHPDKPNPFACPEATTTYTLTVTDSSDPPHTASDSVIATVIPAPELTLHDDTVFVHEQLCIDPGGVFDSCRWSGGQTACAICTTFTSSGDRTLWLTAFDQGCSTTDTMVVHVLGCVPPSDVQATDDDCNKVVVTWTDNSDREDSCRIYRSGTRIGKVGANVTTYTDYPTPGTYTYCVKSFCGIDSSAAVCDPGTRLGPPNAPASCSATVGLCGHVLFSWSPVSEATAYHVFRDSQELTPPEGIPGTSYDDTDCQPGTPIYAVKASNTCGLSTGSCSDQGSCVLAPPRLDTCLASDLTYCDYVRVAWARVSGATGYNVYRDGPKITPSPVTDTVYDDWGAVQAHTHSYQVEVLSACGSSGLSPADPGSRNASPNTPGGFSASDGTRCDKVRLSWQASARADEYNVYRDNEWLASTSSLSYDDVTAVVDEVYSYCVKAENTCDESECSLGDDGWASGGGFDLVVTRVDGAGCGLRATLKACPLGGTPPFAYAWQFDDGGQVSATDVDSCDQTDHTYPDSVGKYTVVAQVTDGAGCEASESYEVTIERCSDSLVTDVSFYPNPVATGGHLTYTLWQDANVTVEIFTLRGRRLRSFTDADATDGDGSSPGKHEIAWDLTNESGSVVGNGVYVLRLTATGSQTNKTVQLQAKVSVGK